jgi:hypothetical protein
MADAKRRKARAAKERVPVKKTAGFRPGKSGVCEAQLWEFSGPSKFLPEDQEIALKRVAAASLDDALRFVRRRYPDFIIVKAEATGVVVMLAGSPFE